MNLSNKGNTMDNRDWSEDLDEEMEVDNIEERKRLTIRVGSLN